MGRRVQTSGCGGACRNALTAGHHAELMARMIQFAAGGSEVTALRGRLGLVLLGVALALGRPSHAQEPPPAPKQGAALLKTDILGVFAHPDDETGMATTLAHYALGRQKVVANVYCTRGEGGGNMVGTQAAQALGVLREAELRDCLTTLGVRYCYFLDRLDWAYTESASATLEKWGKEETLGRLVRLVRALRPEVILTMNPAPAPGQHGHHQSAGILATEAFAAAADPRRFPDQLVQEGLSVWQPRKLYFGGNSGNVLATIPPGQALPDGRTPAQIAGQALANHRSQAFGNFANSPWLGRPQTFSLVKSFAPAASSEDDLLRGLPLAPEGLAPTELAPPAVEPPLSLSFVPRPAFARYRQWVKQQHIEHVAARFAVDLPALCGQPNELRLELANQRTEAVAGDLKLELPGGWTVSPAQQRISIGPRATAMVKVNITPPATRSEDVEVQASFVAGTERCEASARLHPVPRAVAVRVANAPTLDAAAGGWTNLSGLVIAPKDLSEGRVASEADSSATFRVGHDRRTLFVEVQVRDDVVVTNIEPNDIKGHWRSDSIEICVDPVGGAEHTMACFKLGIFPFDTTGVVRAARDADANQGPLAQTAPGTRLFSRRTTDGYLIRAALPFSELGIQYTKGRRIGFNLIVYDGDKRDAAPGENINKSRIAWSPRPGVQGRPEDWGRLELE